MVGTSGLLVLPHMSAGSVRHRGHRLADAARRSTFRNAITMREFVDAVLAGGRTPCSAGFDYAGPLTESVLIGNVAAHFPGETLAFDAAALRFPDKPEANQHLTRSLSRRLAHQDIDAPAPAFTDRMRAS